jgi:hypothetical protein
MAIRRMLLSRLAEALGPSLDARVEAVVAAQSGRLATRAEVDALKSEVARLSARLDAARASVAGADVTGRLGSLSASLDALVERLTAASTSVNGLEAEVARVQGKADASAAEVSAAAGEVVALSERAAKLLASRAAGTPATPGAATPGAATPSAPAAPTPEPAPPLAPPAPAPLADQGAVEAALSAAASTASRVCRVPDCGGGVRARGFCGRHYQLWTRGNLADFVLADGRLFTSNGVFRVDNSLATLPCAVDGEVVRVAGVVVPAIRQP